MAFWRMQLHPNDSENAVKHTTQSLASGFIGLDFANPPGDLTDAVASDIGPSERDYWEFAHTMMIGDIVLIMAHHYPFAIVRVSGNYNYVRTPVNKIGVWFRHFREVDEIRYYGDLVTNASNWERLVMTDTISILRDPTKASYRLIEQWLHSAI